MILGSSCLIFKTYSTPAVTSVGEQEETHPHAADLVGKSSSSAESRGQSSIKCLFLKLNKSLQSFSVVQCFALCTLCFSLLFLTVGLLFQTFTLAAKNWDLSLALASMPPILGHTRILNACPSLRQCSSSSCYCSLLVFQKGGL